MIETYRAMTYSNSMLIPTSRWIFQIACKLKKIPNHPSDLYSLFTKNIKISSFFLLYSKRHNFLRLFIAARKWSSMSAGMISPDCKAVIMHAHWIVCTQGTLRAQYSALGCPHPDNGTCDTSTARNYRHRVSNVMTLPGNIALAPLLAPEIWETNQ